MLNNNSFISFMLIGTTSLFVGCTPTATNIDSSTNSSEANAPEESADMPVGSFEVFGTVTAELDGPTYVNCTLTGKGMKPGTVDGNPCQGAPRSADKNNTTACHYLVIPQSEASETDYLIELIGNCKTGTAGSR